MCIGVVLSQQVVDKKAKLLRIHLWQIENVFRQGRYEREKDSKTESAKNLRRD